MGNKDAYAVYRIADARSIRFFHVRSSTDLSVWRRRWLLPRPLARAVWGQSWSAPVYGLRAIKAVPFQKDFLDRLFDSGRCRNEDEQNIEQYRLPRYIQSVEDICRVYHLPVPTSKGSITDLRRCRSLSRSRRCYSTDLAQRRSQWLLQGSRTKSTQGTSKHVGDVPCVWKYKNLSAKASRESWLRATHFKQLIPIASSTCRLDRESKL